MAYLLAGDAKIYYEWRESNNGGLKGPSNCVTLLNGHTRPVSDFKSLRAHLHSEGYSTLAIDMRGNGATITNNIPFTRKDVMADVEAVWAEVGIGSTALLGVSMGGVVAQALFLGSTGVNIETLILVSTTYSERLLPVYEPFQRDLAKIESKLAEYVTPIFYEKNSLLVKSMAKQIYQKMDSEQFLERALQQRAILEGFDFEDDWTAKLPPHNRIGWIHGGEDKIIPPADKEFVEKTKNLIQFIVYPQCGHLLLAENPKQLYEDILKLLL